MNYQDTFEQWFQQNLSEYAEDIANHGADGGFPHITYTNEIVEIFNKYEDEIWQMVNDSANEYGAKDIADFIGSFNRIDMAESFDGFKNLLVWFACEDLAYRSQD